MLKFLLLAVVGLIALLILSAILKQLWKVYKFHRIQRLFVATDPSNRKMIPSLPMNFGLGQFYEYFLSKDDIFDFTLKMHKVPEEKRGKLATVWLFMTPMVSIAHPEFVKYFMISKAIKFPKSMYGVGLFKPFLGEGLVLSDGDKWRRHRMLVNQVFTEQNMAKMISKMVNSSKELVSTWQSSFGKGTSGSFVLDDTQEEISKLTLNVITACAFGTHVDLQEMGDAWNGVFGKFMSVAIPMMIHPSLLYLPLPANKTVLENTKRVHSMAMDIIKKRKHELEAKRGSSSSSTTSEDSDNVELLNLLLEAQDEHGYMTEQDVMDETLTFLFAGHDTTSSWITWALYMFAQHPEMQQRAQQEIHEVLGAYSPEKQFTNEDLKKLNYLNWFLNETLRMYPPVQRVEKYAAEDNQIGEYVIPKDSIVALDIIGLHRNPQVWKNPNVFDPERFSPERLAADLKFPLNCSLAAFSIGARNCVGKPFAQTEAVLVLALLLQRFTVQFPAGFEPKKIRKDMTPVLKALGLKLTFIPVN